MHEMRIIFFIVMYVNKYNYESQSFSKVSKQLQKLLISCKNLEHVFQLHVH